MDIRNFFQKATASLKRKKGRGSSSDSSNSLSPNRSVSQVSGPSTSTPLTCTSASSNTPLPSTSARSNTPLPSTSASSNTPLPSTSASSNTPLPSTSASSNTPLPNVPEEVHENDLGRYVGRSGIIPLEKKKDLLANPWIPDKKYNFKADIENQKRKFNHSWLEQYSPWLVYSKRLKGALCLHCVLFSPNPSSVQGIVGSFIVRPFTNFRKIHDQCKHHAESIVHKTATAKVKDFTDSVPVDVQLQTAHNRTLDQNKQIVSSIIKSIIFCGTHNMSLRGKHNDEGILLDMLKLRIEAGDELLKDHLEHCKKNAKYTSPSIQNEIIDIIGNVIKDTVLADARKAMCYAVMADETADISGKEQLSIGLRFFDQNQKVIREEFVGFQVIEKQDAETIANTIDSSIISFNLMPENCIGFGFDGCSTMAGKENGVQAILRRKYNKAFFFHCSSHRLNLVVNDLNKVSEIRNTIATVKDTINFFRESPSRKQFAPNISKMCETRWSEKHKAIERFEKHFIEIVKSLDLLSTTGNNATRKSAYQLHSAITKSSFIVSFIVIAKYSAFLTPVVNILQKKSIDMVNVCEHMDRIEELFTSDRNEAERITAEILEKAEYFAEELDIELTLPRVTERQTLRANPPASNASEYWRRTIVIPYLDSVISSMKTRFSPEHRPPFELSSIHPACMIKKEKTEFLPITENIAKFFNIENMKGEAELWYVMWHKKNLSSEEAQEIDVIDLIREATPFFPAMRKALIILSSLPPTTATVERSFSTLRKIKTWLRSTMGEDRLNGLSLMSVHRKLVEVQREEIHKSTLEIFARNPRRMLFQ